MSRTPVRGFAAAITLVAAGTAAADLTVLPASNGLMEGISSTGLAAGSFGLSEYFIWSPENGFSLIGGSVPGGGVGGQAKVSEDGLFISGTSLNKTTGLNEMSRYDVVAGAWTTLGSLGSSSGVEASSGWAVSGDGQSVVGLGWISAGGAHAAQWDAATGTVTDLGSTVAGSSSRANGTDFDGDVVVGWQDGNGRQGAVWVDGVQELITLPDGQPASEAFGVSADGRWVSGIAFAGGFGVAETYRYDTVTDTVELIPNLASGGMSRMAGTAVSADGATIVGGTWGFGPATFGTALIWREGVGTVTIPEYLDELGVDYDPTYVFAFVADMSDDGRWLVGWGRNASNQLTSWILEVPADAPCTGDLDESGSVDFNDVLAVLAAWGVCDGCPEDLDASGTVDFDDVLGVLSAFGPCP